MRETVAELGDRHGRKWAWLVVVVVVVLGACAGLGTESTTTTATAGTDRRVLASWEIEWGSEITVTESLVYGDGAMSLVSAYPDGESERDVAERPAVRPDERRFDLHPDEDRSEYVVLSADDCPLLQLGRTPVPDRKRDVHGVRCHDLGFNPVEKECVPEVLSPTSLEIIDLYERLYRFKDDPQFARRASRLAARTTSG